MVALRSRHIGIAGLSVMGIAEAIIPTVCDNFDPTNPQALILPIIMVVVGIFTGIDTKRNSGKN